MLLLPTLVRTAQKDNTTSRVVIVSSGVHEDVQFGKDRIPKGRGVLEMLCNEEDSTKEHMQMRYHETKRA